MSGGDVVSPECVTAGLTWGCSTAADVDALGEGAAARSVDAAYVACPAEDHFWLRRGHVYSDGGGAVVERHVLYCVVDSSATCANVRSVLGALVFPTALGLGPWRWELSCSVVLRAHNQL